MENRTDKRIRCGTAAVVVAVAGFAAVVSFSHIYDLGRTHHEAGTAARLLPLSVDGLILAASLVMLHEARNGRRTPRLSYWMLGAGVGATVAANVFYGLPFGVLAAVLAAWPAVAFIGSVEMLMALVRTVRAVPGPVPGDAPRPVAVQPVPGIAKIKARYGVGQPKAKLIQGDMAALAGANGHKEVPS